MEKEELKERLNNQILEQLNSYHNIEYKPPQQLAEQLTKLSEIENARYNRKK